MPDTHRHKFKAVVYRSGSFLIAGDAVMCRCGAYRIARLPRREPNDA